MQLTTFTLKLGHEKFLRKDVPKIRGYFASRFPRYIELHHHLPAQKLVYAYPVVQYKVLDHTPVILGVAGGVDILMNIYSQVNELKLDGYTIPITEKQMTQRTEPFGLFENIQFYRFLTPWLGLNQTNYQRFQKANRRQRQELLHRILTGNLLALSKAFNYTVPGRIYVAAETRLTITRLKSTELSGFTGYFAVNFQIPDFLGIGKSVSRGFGTVKKVSFEELF